MAITRIGNIASTIPDSSVQNVKMSNIVQSKNIIINGDMSIAQRATSTASITSGGYHTVDRFNTNLTTLGTWTQSQSTDVPTGQGFAKSLKMECTTADASPASGDLLRITQLIEGQNVQYLKKGTSSSESTTASFWVKSNKTGTYVLEIRDRDNNRAISQSYTISSADTWEKKTLTYVGDTTGTLNNDNGSSLELVFWLGAGSSFTSGTLQTSWGTRTDANTAVGQVNLADSTANEWYITGVQLEAGTSASEFEFLPHDMNLNRCYRYCYRVNGNSSDEQQSGVVGWSTANNTLNAMMRFVPELRTSPTVTESDMSQTTTGTAISLTGVFDDNDTSDCNAIGLSFSADSGTPFTTGNVMFPRVNSSTSAFIQFDSEL